MEFIFENPIFIIVIIGYIISFFMKNKQGQSQKNPKNARPDVKPSPAQVFKEIQERIPQLSTAMNDERERRKAEEAQRLEKEMLERRKLAEASMNALMEQKEMAEEQAMLIKAASVSAEQIPSTEVQPKQSISPSKKQLIDGIIWSEIIGPPRALNPHKSLKNNK